MCRLRKTILGKRRKNIDCVKNSRYNRSRTTDLQQEGRVIMSEIICISRSYGSGGRTVGKMLSEQLSLPCYDRELIYLASENSRLDKDTLARHDEQLEKASFSGAPSEMNPYRSRDDVYACQSQIIRDVADKGNCILIGRCAAHILKNTRHQLLRVFVWAPEHVCVKTVMDKFAISEKEAAKMTRQINKHRADYYKHHTGMLWTEASNYDLCIDTSRLSYEQAVKAISAYAQVFFRL